MVSRLIGDDFILVPLLAGIGDLKAELGVAVARGIKVIVVGHAGDDCIFTYLKSVEKFQTVCY